jgi:hypothetical protein
VRQDAADHRRVLEPPSHPRSHPPHVRVRGRRGRTEVQRAVRVAHEHTIEHERMEVYVEIHRAAEALHARHHAGLSTRHPWRRACRRYALRSARTKTLSIVRHSR